MYDRREISPRRGDFGFARLSGGAWSVTYTSPVTGKSWSTLADSPETLRLVEAVRIPDSPRIVMMRQLRALCKSR